MKGIILAGGTGSRLFPITKSVSKQLLNVFDKPMVYYPLSTLMLSGIREICLITTPHDLSQYRDLLRDGSHLGLEITYIQQEKPEGLPQALSLAEKFLDGSSCCLVLGDNIFYGPSLGTDLRKYTNVKGAQIFGYQVHDPERYGVVEISEGRILSMEEKPLHPKSNVAITGLYYFDNTASERAKLLEKSPRGEFEMLDLLENYRANEELKIAVLPRGTAWLDTGTPEALHEASAFIKAIQERQGLLISSPEEIAFRNGWLTSAELQNLCAALGRTKYAEYLTALEA